MDGTGTSASKAAHLGGTMAMAAAAFVVVGVGGAALDVLAPFRGFLLMVLGLGMALVALLTSVVGVVATGRGLGGRSLALRGLLVSGAIVGVIALQASRGGGLPRINDITTDLDDPPVFVAALEAGPNQGRDMAYPGAAFAEQQLKAYPDLASLVLQEEPPAAFERVRAALATMPHMEITGENRAEGRIEATEKSALFHFADDVVVRIRPFQDGGSRVDVRSKSRDGKGDLGVNARRIRELFRRVRESAGAGGGD